jgi:glycerol dehydrogenase-like iron-containing ADH family enzyme
LEKIETAIRSAHGNVDLLVQRSDLPADVQMSVNFFEKATSFIKDENLKHKLVFMGDILNSFKTSKATVEVLGKALQTNSVIVNEASKK